MSTPPAASSSSDCKEPSAPQQRSHRRTRSVSPCRRGRSASPRRPRIRDQDCLEVCLSGPSPKWNRSLPVLGDTTVGALRHSVSEMMQVGAPKLPLPHTHTHTYKESHMLSHAHAHTHTHTHTCTRTNIPTRTRIQELKAHTHGISSCCPCCCLWSAVKG